jgi:hypothetical protein
MLAGKCILFTDSIHDDKLAMFEAGKKAMDEAAASNPDGATSSSSSEVSAVDMMFE